MPETVVERTSRVNIDYDSTHRKWTKYLNNYLLKAMQRDINDRIKFIYQEAMIP